MKKFFTMLFMILLPMTALAYEPVVMCNRSGTENITCTINLNIDTDDGVSNPVTDVSFKYVVPEGYEYSKFETELGHNTIDGANNTISFTFDDGMSSNVTLGTINLKRKDAECGYYKLVLTDVKINGSEHSDVESANVGYCDNTLTGINASDGSLSPSYDSATTTYDLNVLSSKVTISPVYESYINKIDDITVDLGSETSKTVTISVSSKYNQTPNTYTINVKKGGSTNNDLKDLELSKGKINFDKSKDEYSVDVDSDVEEIEISAELDDENASFVENYGPRKVSLEYGKNTVQIKVKSQVGEEKTYTINVTREDDREVDTNIKTLEITGYQLDFKSGITDYNIKVTKDVDKLDLNIVLSNEDSIVEIEGNENFVIGENVVKLNVKAVDGSIKTYTIIVNKVDKIKLANNNYIKKLEIDGYDIDFNYEKLDYELDYNGEEYLDFNITLDDSDAEYEIINNKKLAAGSVITIKVTAEDGSIREYTITLNEPQKVSSSSFNKYFIIGGIIFIIIVLIVVIVIISKKNKKDNTDTNNVTVSENADANSVAAKENTDANSVAAKENTDVNNVAVAENADANNVAVVENTDANNVAAKENANNTNIESSNLNKQNVVISESTNNNANSAVNIPVSNSNIQNVAEVQTPQVVKPVIKEAVNSVNLPNENKVVTPTVNITPTVNSSLYTNVTPTNYRVCPRCGNNNAIQNKFCYACFEPLDTKEDNQ